MDQTALPVTAPNDPDPRWPDGVEPVLPPRNRLDADAGGSGSTRTEVKFRIAGSRFPSADKYAMLFPL
jgi:hypothetical protein